MSEGTSACGVCRPIVASDCLNVINNIKEMARCAYIMILPDIYQTSKSFDCVRFTHKGKEFNRDAYYLAKYVCSLETGRHIWLGSPPMFFDVNILK